jgi:hypothetical protein
MNSGDFFALGQKPAIKGQSPSLQVDELLNYLVTNTYSKLSYIKVRQPDPAAEIRAVLSADSLGQTSIGNLGEEGNPLAMAEMRQYLTVAASSGRVLLSDVVSRFEGAPWGWRPELETVLLIARLFMAGEIKLVMEGNDLDPKAAIEPLTKPARFKQVSLLKRKTADAGTRAKARELHKDLFATLPPEDEDALVATFRTSLAELKSQLDRAKGKAEQKHFPGLAEITSALTTIDKQLAIRDPFEFIAALLAAKNDWLDLYEDTHDVLNFYKTQAPVWSRMLEAMTGFADNHTELAKDPAAAAAMAELERIHAHKTPYAQVNKIEALLVTVEKVNDGLAAERRTQGIEAIDSKIAEATQALDAAQAEAALRNTVLKPLQDLKLQLAGLSSIPRILFLQNRAGDLLDEVMDKLAQAEKAKTPAPTPPTGDHGKPIKTGEKTHLAPPASPPPQSRPIKVVRSADVGGKTYLESEADVEDYLARLKKELMAVVQSGQRARIQ